MEKFTELYNDERFDEALTYLDSIKEEGINYYEYVSLKATVLKNLARFDEAIDLIADEIKMPYIPREYDEGFNKLYDELVYLKKQSLGQSVNVFSQEELEQILLANDNFELLVQALMQLKDYNIRNILPTLNLFLTDPEKDSMVKTLIIEILKDQDYSEEITIIKRGKEMVVIPTEIELILETKLLATASALLQDGLAKEPSALEGAFQLLDYYMYDNFPELPSAKSAPVIAAAVHFRTLELFGIDITKKELLEIYKVKIEDLDRELEIVKTY